VRRADRLLKIVQILRRRKRPTSAKLIAEELGVVPRTIYRDIVDLQSSHVPIEGEPGVGYLLRKGYDLPPLMFDEQELEVLVLGARMVADRGDATLAKASEDVIAKVLAVLPERLSEQIWRTALLMSHRAENADSSGFHLPAVRQAVREHNKLRIEYIDGKNNISSRVVWPLGVYFYSHVTIVCTWCEFRNGFRAFRTDRITKCELIQQKFDPKNGDLFNAFMKDWLKHESNPKSNYKNEVI
jgi:predicted DNA-binding transcriptional regulator YafY